MGEPGTQGSHSSLVPGVGEVGSDYWIGSVLPHPPPPPTLASGVRRSTGDGLTGLVRAGVGWQDCGWGWLGKSCGWRERGGRGKQVLSGVWEARGFVLAQPPPCVFLQTLDNPFTSLGFNFLIYNETLILDLLGILALQKSPYIDVSMLGALTRFF